MPEVATKLKPNAQAQTSVSPFQEHFSSLPEWMAQPKRLSFLLTPKIGPASQNVTQVREDGTQGVSSAGSDQNRLGPSCPSRPAAKKLMRAIAAKAPKAPKALPKLRALSPGKLGGKSTPASSTRPLCRGIFGKPNEGYLDY